MSATKLLGIYSDGMIFQRNKEIIIEGTENVLPEVKVTFAGTIKTAVVENGKFKAVLPPFDVTRGESLKVEGTDTIEVTDVCVGDVFMLAGQSNMELPVVRTVDLNKDEIEANDYPEVRQFQLVPDYELPLKGEESICAFPDGKWIKATGEDKYAFSAIGFYAAKRIYEKTGVPIGLILNAQGGATIEAYMSEVDNEACGTKEDDITPFRGKGAIKDYLARCEQNTITWRGNTVVKDFDLEAALADAKDVELPGIVVTGFSGSIWFVKEFELDTVPEGQCLLKLGDLIDADVTYVNGVEVGRTEYQYPPRKYYFDGSILKTGKNIISTRLIIELGKGGFVPGHPYYLETEFGKIDLTGTWKMVPEKKLDDFVPGKLAQMIPLTLYYAALIPLRNFAVSQIWWCQGESNSGEPEGYDKKMILMFKKMREMYGDVPAIIIRIADYINPLTFETEVPEGWREVQRLQDEAPNYIDNVKVVRSPCPDPIHELHPQNKSGIGADVAKASLEF
ncbi:MAG: hypothetical protein IKF31_01590 [Clostridiales bacterium]|nr:hypothetical protein [Clostridiales bacterium]